MRIFIDIGAHYGETLHVALDPKWGFQRIHVLEPASHCLGVLNRFRDPRLVIEPVGLSNRDGSAVLHGAGSLGASLYADKKQAGAENVTETIRLVRASDWFRKNVPGNADVFVKMNCEGGEADILDDLLDSGEIRKVSNLYVDFDIRKVPSQAHRQAEIERRLRTAGIEYLSTEVIGEAGKAGVSEWLERSCRTVQASMPAQLRHLLLAELPAYERIKIISSKILPRKLYWALARKFGRLARTSRP